MSGQVLTYIPRIVRISVEEFASASMSISCLAGWFDFGISYYIVDFEREGERERGGGIERERQTDRQREIDRERGLRLKGGWGGTKKEQNKL